MSLLMEKIFNIKITEKDGCIGLLENGESSVPCCYDDPLEAIKEWEYFEKLNTNSLPHHRFLKEVKSLKLIEDIINNFKNDRNTRVL